jgi:alpha-N-acetylglucosamine transferase
MARPSLALYEYLMGLMPLADGRFNAEWNEQNLLNYAMRRSGPMPWTELNWQWNTWGPNDDDWVQNLKSYHGHLWDYGGYRAEAWAKIRREMEEVSLNLLS